MRRLLILGLSTMLLAAILVAPASATDDGSEATSAEFVARIAHRPQNLGTPYIGVEAVVALAACTAQQNSDSECPRRPYTPLDGLGVTFVFDDSDVGRTIWADSSTPVFAEVVRKITDGNPGFIVPVSGAVLLDGTPLRASFQTPDPEASFFGRQAGPNCVDLQFVDISRIGFQVTEASWESPGSDPNGDGQWTDISYRGRFVFEGQIEGEPCGGDSHDQIARARVLALLQRVHEAPIPDRMKLRIYRYIYQRVVNAH